MSRPNRPSRWRAALIIFLGLSIAASGAAITGVRSVEGVDMGVSSAELYDPRTNRWLPAASLTFARQAHTATPLSSGKVLIAGGSGQVAYSLAFSELYDPEADSWFCCATMAVPRGWHTATLLGDGKVLLVVGGMRTAAKDYQLVTTPLATAELYDPATDSWSPVASMITARRGHTATLLSNGTVLVAGGTTFSNEITDLTELYDPKRNSWSAAGPMTEGRSGHTATVLRDGTVLVVGGRPSRSALATAERYDPSTNAWSAAATMTHGRFGHTATLLDSGAVLVAGGDEAGSAELYEPSANKWSNAGHITSGHGGHIATQVGNGRVLINGGGGFGYFDHCVTAAAELYDPLATTWSNAGTMATARTRHTATLLRNGRILAAGGGTSGSGYRDCPGEKAAVPVRHGIPIRTGLELVGLAFLAIGIATVLLIRRLTRRGPSRSTTPGPSKGE